MIPLSNRFAVLETFETDGVEQRQNTQQHLHNTLIFKQPLRKTYFKWIQTTHHETIITTALHTQTFPKGMTRHTQKLTQFIKPACPNAHTLNEITKNTHRWLETNLQILQDHYVSVKEGLLQKIDQMDETEWEIATKWVKARFGQKFRLETLDKAKEQIQQHLATMSVGVTADSPLHKENIQYLERKTVQEPSKNVVCSPQVQPVKPVTTPPSLNYPRRTKVVIAQVHEPSPKVSTKQHNESYMSSPKPSTMIKSNVSVVMETDLSFSQGESTGESMKREGKEVMSGHVKGNNSLTKAVSEPSLSLSIPPSVSLTPLFRRNREDETSPDFNKNPIYQVPTRHANTAHKITDWTIEAKKPILFIGDSNLSRIPHFTDEQIQVDSYPGANFLHIAKILKQTDPNPDTQKVVLSLGINNKDQHFENTSKKQLQELWRAAATAFPNATIYTPLLNFSDLLLKRHQENLRKLNKFILAHPNPLQELHPLRFRVDPRDPVHWTAETATQMFEYWCDQLNF